MGGTIGVTLRTPDGQVYKTAQWTNPLPRFVVHPRFLAGDTEWVQQYLDYWHAVCRDCDKHKDTGNYEISNTPYYARHQVCAPIEYGLVVLDMQQKVIHTHQNYTSFTSVYSYHFKDEEQTPIFLQFAREGRLTAQRYNPQTYTWDDTGIKFDGSVPDFKLPAYWRSLWRTARWRTFWENVEVFGRTLREQLENVWYHRVVEDVRFKLKLDLAPYQVINWATVDGERVEQFEQMRDAIAQSIPLTPDDHAAWDAWLQRVREEDADEPDDDQEKAEDDHTSH